MKLFRNLATLSILALTSVACSGPYAAEENKNRDDVGDIQLLSTDIQDAKNLVQDNEWQLFKSKFKKSYLGTSEIAHRARLGRNKLRILELNNANKAANGQQPYGITAFSDLSEEEFAERFLTPQAFLQHGNIDETVSLMGLEGPIPQQMDWRDHHAISPVKDQGGCGSCWAFSATEQIESQSFLETGTLPILSVQQITSCDEASSGCRGGYTENAYQYVQNYGLQEESSYPYTSTRGLAARCEYNADKVAARVQGFKYAVAPCKDGACLTQDQKEPALKKFIAHKGPASVCLNATPWQFYQGGILAAECSGALADMTHCAQLVGYGQDDQGQNYWIVRNQWGDQWGLNGYIHIKMGSNVCGIANDVTTADGVQYKKPLEVSNEILSALNNSN